MIRQILATCLFGAVALPLPAGAIAPPHSGAGSVIVDEATHVQRIALIVGANSGGEDRATLRYATSDARAFERVLAQVGGLSRTERVILLDPTPSELERAFDAMRKLAKQHTQPGARSEFLFYYSGHSDEQGLLLDRSAISYSQLRTWIDQVSADVHIAVLDSCASGAFTRIKGGIRREPFMLGGAGSVKGHAFLTSSSADETAQESDRIGGSFFTHYLVSGLRGAADVDTNGVVTLNEAFLFARNETLARTSNTQAGPQHAAYDFRLAGTGDLVLTDVRKADASLIFPAKITGRVFVRNDKEQLVAELYKAAGAGPVRLALEPGTYNIVVEQPNETWKATMVVSSGESMELQTSALIKVERERVAIRGDEAAGEPASQQAAAPTNAPAAPAATSAPVTSTPPTWTRVPFHFGLVPGMQAPPKLPGTSIETTFSLSLLWGHVDRVRGVAGAFGATRVRENLWGAQIALGASLVGGRVHGAQFALGMSQAQALHGVQGALGLAIVDDKVDGIQGAFGGAINAGNTRGGQIALGLTVTGGRLDGIQGALGANFATEASRGAQLALGANMAPQGLQGIQGALGFNVNKHVQGAQLALGANAAGRVEGVQAGLVNVAKGGRGSVQLGFVNIADDADVQIGYVSVSRKHGVRPIAWASELSPVNVGVHFNANYTYSEIFFSMVPQFGLVNKNSVGTWRPAFGAVLGARLLKMPRLELDFDVVSMGLVGPSDSEEKFWASARLLVEYRLARHFGIFGGPTFTTGVDFREEARRRKGGYLWKPFLLERTDDVDVTATPGFAFGLRF